MRNLIAQHDVQDAADCVHPMPHRSRVECQLDSLYGAHRDSVEIERVEREARSARKSSVPGDQDERRVGSEAAQLRVLSAAATRTIGAEVRLLRNIFQQI